MSFSFIVSEPSPFFEFPFSSYFRSPPAECNWTLSYLPSKLYWSNLNTESLSVELMKATPLMLPLVSSMGTLIYECMIFNLMTKLLNSSTVVLNDIPLMKYFFSRSSSGLHLIFELVILSLGVSSNLDTGIKLLLLSFGLLSNLDIGLKILFISLDLSYDLISVLKIISLSLGLSIDFDPLLYILLFS